MTASRTLSALIFSLGSVLCFSQENLSLSGNLESNVNFYIRDEKIGASNTPQYDHQQIGTDTWLSVSAQIAGFDFGIRYDIFANSALLNPTDSYTDQGFGRWYIGKKIGKLSLMGGHIYDQFGGGVIFKAYEERALFIDNALVGLRATYQISPNWTLKGIAGRQKDIFDLYPSVLTGLNLEGFKALGKDGKVTLAPGVGIVHKTLSDEQMDALANELAGYTPEDFISEVPYNTIAASIYNTLSVGRFSWYLEAAYKTEEVMYDNFAVKTLWTGEKNLGKYVLEPGYVAYTSLTYAGGGLGLTGQYKLTSYFNFRTDPFVSLNQGMINFLPPMSRINTYRLTARYSPATQELDEEAYQFDGRYAINKNLSVVVNFADITRPHATEHKDIYTELYTQVIWKKPQKWTLISGVQFQKYDQELYEGKAGAPNVQAVTPYLDFLYKLDQKTSLRTELQYMQTKQDYGSWMYGLEEFAISPHWFFELSDMWNIDPKKNVGGSEKPVSLHYPTVGVTYSAGSTRYNFRYVKQVEGIVCSGGICRLEPAFSGFKFTLSSSF